MAEVSRILCEAGVHVLDGTSFEIYGVGFAGVKGFAGGFGRRALGPWGEEIIKLFVQEALNEALKLETALARLRTEHRIVLMHYSPIEGTVVGEPKEIYPYLGSSRLEEPLTRYPVDAVFHGHAHHGTAEGRTRTGVPVYNVSINLMQREHPDGPLFRFLDVPVDGSNPD
jgi:Icc-related predicted phosphoesterase